MFIKQDEIIEKFLNVISPLTYADIASHQLIIDGLQRLTPDLPILSEESQTIPYNERKQWDIYWLIDPLGGTKEFINHSDEFTINIALIENGLPKLGIVYARPRLDNFMALLYSF